MRKTKLIIIIILLFAKTSDAQKLKITGMYFQWGYNTEWYTKSNLHFKLNNGSNFTLHNVKASDKPDMKGIYESPLDISIPQYNYRIGYFFNKKKNLAFEINFDHTKYIIADQDVRIKGKLNNRVVDSTIRFDEANGFQYFLNNGANFLLFNLVKRWNYTSSHNQNFKLDGLGKVGVGPIIPHVQNTFFGKDNDQRFQLGGWNVGLEYALRATFYKTVYLEFASKVDYAGYSGLDVYKGKARQMFGTFEMILNLGFTFPAGKKIK